MKSDVTNLKIFKSGNQIWKNKKKSNTRNRKTTKSLTRNPAKSPSSSLQQPSSTIRSSNLLSLEQIFFIRFHHRAQSCSSLCQHWSKPSFPNFFFCNLKFVWINMRILWMFGSFILLVSLNLLSLWSFVCNFLITYSVYLRKSELWWIL